MTTDVSCPQRRRVFTRRRELELWQKSPEFIAMRTEHARQPGIKCAKCGREHGQQLFDQQGNPKINKKGEPVFLSLTINHISRDTYLTKELYCTWNPLKMEPICNSCNLAHERGEKCCPDCLKEGRINYIKWYDDECWHCYLKKHPDIATQREQAKYDLMQKKKEYNANQAKKRKAAKQAHPCKLRRISGACGKSPLGSRCTFSPRNAPKKCMDYEEKKVKK